MLNHPIRIDVVTMFANCVDFLGFRKNPEDFYLELFLRWGLLFPPVSS
jgi:hypothetical protein